MESAKLCGQHTPRRLWAKQSFSPKIWKDIPISLFSSTPLANFSRNCCLDKCGFTRKSSAWHVHCLTLPLRRLRTAAHSLLPFFVCFLWKELLESEPSSIYCRSSLSFAQSPRLSCHVTCKDFSSPDYNDCIWFWMIERLCSKLSLCSTWNCANQTNPSLQHSKLEVMEPNEQWHISAKSK